MHNSRCMVLGVLGKRTRFQQTEIAQLVLQVTTAKPSPQLAGRGGAEETDLPREVSMDDETILDKVSLTDAVPVVSLSSLQQAALLGSW